jgi:hypothetical protein
MQKQLKPTISEHLGFAELSPLWSQGLSLGERWTHKPILLDEERGRGIVDGKQLH